MMLKIMIILLASDDEGTTLKLHSHGQLLARLVARNLQWVGLSRRCETKLKQFTLGIGTVFCPKLGEGQKKKRKKRSSPVLGSSFATEFSSSSKSE